MGPFVEHVTDWMLAKGQLSLEEAEALAQRGRLPERDTGLQAQYPDRRPGPRQWSPYYQPRPPSRESLTDCQMTEPATRRQKMSNANPNYDMTVDVDINEDEFFTSVTPELAEKMEAESKAASTGGGTSYFRWEAGKAFYYLRLVPPPKSWGNIFFVQRRHWATKPDGKRVPLPCIAHLGKDCPGCTTTNEAGNLPGGLEMQDGMKTQISYLYNVIDTEAPETKQAMAEGRQPPIQVYSATKTAHEQIQALLAEGHDLLSPDGGFPVKVTKTTQKGNTRYSAQTAAKKWPMQRAWLAGQPQLPNVANPISMDSEDATTRLESDWNEIRAGMGLPQLGAKGRTAALPPMKHSRPPSGGGLGKNL